MQLSVVVVLVVVAVVEEVAVAEEVALVVTLLEAGVVAEGLVVLLESLRVPMHEGKRPKLGISCFDGT